MARFSRGVAIIATPVFRTVLFVTLFAPRGWLFAQPIVEPRPTETLLAGQGVATPLPPGMWHESPIIGRAAEEFERRVAPVARPRNGFFVEFGNAITGAGF